MNDPICAIATPPGYGAIAIIKVSGENIIELINPIFKGKNLNEVETHTINYGFIHNEQKIIDEVLLTVMKAPKTYTKEDIIEINCHGGYIAAERIIKLLLKKGIRIAENGEFTKRAFINGRISLLDADIINSMIVAKTELSHEIAINNFTKNPTVQIQEIREQLMKIIGNIMVNIDYPEYLDTHQITDIEISELLIPIEIKIKEIIKNSQVAQVIRKGFTVGIIGRPNVGKSSLLNRILNEEKAIVTNIEGTTRDIVEGEIIIDQIPFLFMDTAGLRETKDEIEAIGVEKSKKILKESNIILYILNNNEKINQEELNEISKIDNSRLIILINKIDLETKLNEEELKTHQIVQISTKDNIGIDNLIEALRNKVKINELEINSSIYLSNLNSINKIEQSLETLEEIKNDINQKLAIDIIETKIRSIWETLGEIIGEHYEEEMLDNLFNMFCIGK